MGTGQSAARIEESAIQPRIVEVRGEHRKYLPYAFTEHGAVQAANVLRSKRATTMSVRVVRAFVRMRQALATQGQLGSRLRELERALFTLDLKTDARFEEVFRAIRALMQPPEKPQRPIGFVPLEDAQERSTGIIASKYDNMVTREHG